MRRTPLASSAEASVSPLKPLRRRPLKVKGIGCERSIQAPVGAARRRLLTLKSLGEALARRGDRIHRENSVRHGVTCDVEPEAAPISVAPALPMRALGIVAE